MTEVRNILDGLELDESLFIGFCSRKEIHRLRELRSPHDYLLRLRANAVVDCPRAIRVFLARRVEHEQRGGHWSLTQYYHRMDRHHKIYTALLSRAHREALKTLPSGMALVPDANAICVRSILGDVVVVSEALEHFYYFMTLAFFGNRIGLALEDQMSALCIAIRIMNGAESLDFDLDPRGILPQQAERFVRSQVDAQLQFTFGHEFAHSLLNHMPAPSEGSSARRSGDGSAIATCEHEMEYEADLHAVRHIAYDIDARARVARGAIAVLVFLAFVEECGSRHNLQKVRVLSTHPRSLDRAWRLLGSVGRRTGMSREQLSTWIAMSEQLQELFGRILSRRRPDALSFYGSIYLPGFVGKLRRDRIDF